MSKMGVCYGVVVPKKGRDAVISLLHEGHPGVVRMKRLARGYVWWPGIDHEIELDVKMCTACQEHQKLPAKAPMHPWEWPDNPWARLHIDYAGPLNGKMILVIVDSYSKWIEAHTVSSATSLATIEKLRLVFSTHGLPEVLVSDNGSCFTSEEFATFMRNNGIKHLTSTPYHPAANGLAERAVQTLKIAIKKDTSGATMETKIYRFLLQYCLTPHSTTGLAPAELLIGRRPRSRLDLLYPDVRGRVRQRQERQKLDHDRHCRDREFLNGQQVWVWNHSTGPSWVPGVVVRVINSQRFAVQLEDGHIIDRHVDNLKPRISQMDRPVLVPSSIIPQSEILDRDHTPDPPPDIPPPNPLLRRSGRDRRPPEIFM